MWDGRRRREKEPGELCLPLAVLGRLRLDHSLHSSATCGSLARARWSKQKSSQLAGDGWTSTDLYEKRVVCVVGDGWGTQLSELKVSYLKTGGNDKRAFVERFRTD